VWSAAGLVAVALPPLSAPSPLEVYQQVAGACACSCDACEEPQENEGDISPPQTTINMSPSFPPPPVLSSFSFAPAVQLVIAPSVSIHRSSTGVALTMDKREAGAVE
ncbi:hypothetical protein DQ04_24891000, partial [Trypanosoma grayi]|uniref:hypothetical protein n=1 Tax=Trypanosoma grayi TaxID=71804 RepID=UPI0004F4B6E4